MITVSVQAQRAAKALAKMSRTMGVETARALNSVAFDVQKAERGEIQRVFDRPTPYIVKQVRVFKAEADNLRARVGANDWFGTGGRFAVKGKSGTTWEQILTPHIRGGTRLHKSHEVRLQMIGAMPKGWFAIPGPGLRKNQYGNASGAEIMTILASVGAMNLYAGDASNRVAEKTRKRKSITDKRGHTYYVIDPGQGLAPGIWRRNRTQVANNGVGVPVIWFVPSVSYRKRFDWYGVARRTIDARLPQAVVGAFGRMV